jgi:hypothetical protein
MRKRTAEEGREEEEKKKLLNMLSEGPHEYSSEARYTAVGMRHLKFNGSNQVLLCSALCDFLPVLVCSSHKGNLPPLKTLKSGHCVSSNCGVGRSHMWLRVDLLHCVDSAHVYQKEAIRNA